MQEHLREEAEQIGANLSQVRQARKERREIDEEQSSCPRSQAFLSRESVSQNSQWERDQSPPNDYGNPHRIPSYRDKQSSVYSSRYHAAVARIRDTEQRAQGKSDRPRSRTPDWVKEVEREAKAPEDRVTEELFGDSASSPNGPRQDKKDKKDKKDDKKDEKKDKKDDKKDKEKDKKDKKDRDRDSEARDTAGASGSALILPTESAGGGDDDLFPDVEMHHRAQIMEGLHLTVKLPDSELEADDWKVTCA